MPVGVIDVGSNTIRLLVAEGDEALLTRKATPRLGADVERHGRITPAKLAEAEAVVAEFGAAARAAGVDQLEVLITSPGRQAANGNALVDLLAAAAGFPARVLSAVEEGRLAFVGALDGVSGPAGRTVAVIDVGGGSAQVVVGSRRDGPVWARSIDLGSQRLTSRLLAADPPGARAVDAARAEAERYLDAFDPPPVRAAFAVGGSARALKRIAGARLDVDELEDLLRLLAETPVDEIAERHGVGADRAHTLAAGCVILSTIQRRLGTPLKVARGGLREGALVGLREQRAAA